MQRIICFLAGILLTFNAAAALSYQQLLEDSNTHWSRMYLLGIHNGIHIANTQLLLDGRKRMYCMPENVQVDSKLLYGLLERYVANSPKAQGMRVDWMLLYALMKEYPCKRTG
jgi:hypothetical protein